MLYTSAFVQCLVSLQKWVLCKINNFIKIESWKIIHGESVKNSVFFFPIQNIPSGVIFAAKNVSGDRTFFFLMVRRNGKSQSVSLPLGWDNEWLKSEKRGSRDHPQSSHQRCDHTGPVTCHLLKWRGKNRTLGMKQEQNSTQPKLKNKMKSISERRLQSEVDITPG